MSYGLYQGAGICGGHMAPGMRHILAYLARLRTASIPTGLPLQGELDLSGRNVALLWDFDNIRPPGGARAAAHTVHLLQVCGKTSMSGPMMIAAGVRHHCGRNDTLAMLIAGCCHETGWTCGPCHRLCERGSSGPLPRAQECLASRRGPSRTSCCDQVRFASESVDSLHSARKGRTSAASIEDRAVEHRFRRQASGGHSPAVRRGRLREQAPARRRSSAGQQRPRLCRTAAVYAETGLPQHQRRCASGHDAFPRGWYSA